MAININNSILIMETYVICVWRSDKGKKGVLKSWWRRNSRVLSVLKMKKNYNDIMNNIQASVVSLFHDIFFLALHLVVSSGEDLSANTKANSSWWAWDYICRNLICLLLAQRTQSLIEVFWKSVPKPFLEFQDLYMALSSRLYAPGTPACNSLIFPVCT